MVLIHPFTMRAWKDLALPMPLPLEKHPKTCLFNDILTENHCKLPLTDKPLSIKEFVKFVGIRSRLQAGPYDLPVWLPGYSVTKPDYFGSPFNKTVQY